MIHHDPEFAFLVNKENLENITNLLFITHVYPLFPLVVQIYPRLC